MPGFHPLSWGLRKLCSCTTQLRLSLRIIPQQHLSKIKSSGCSCTSQEITVSAVILPSTKLPVHEQRGTARQPAPSSLLLDTSCRRSEFLGAVPFLKSLWMMLSCKHIQVAPRVDLTQSAHHFAEFMWSLLCTREFKHMWREQQLSRVESCYALYLPLV